MDDLSTRGIALAMLLMIIGGLLGSCKDETPQKPNIIFIMADDMGYGDVRCYNPQSKIPTPHMDQLAREGIRFTDAHSPSAVCTPTRYGVLTGRYCWRTWLKRGVIGGYTPPLIDPQRPTLGTVLQQSNYTTACIGKWHLGLSWTRMNGMTPTAEDASRYWLEHWFGSWQDGDPERGANADFSKPVLNGPADLGFDFSYITAACSTIDGPFAFIENRELTAIPDKMIEVDTSKHADLRPRPGWVASNYDIETVDVEFTSKAIEFMKDSKENDPDNPFFVYLALSSPHAPWLPPDFTEGTTEEGPRGDLVSVVDWSVGQIMDFLEQNDLEDNTILILTSDNGPRHGANGHASAGPLRGYKSHIWEGGHRVPFIARWPGKIPEEAVSEQLLCLTDMMATFAAIAGCDIPKNGGEDSYNLLPALLDPQVASPLRNTLVSHSENGTFSIREGNWKLIMDNKTSGGWVEPSGKRPEAGTPGQLYDLENDPYERNDLWEEETEKVEELTLLFEKIENEEKSVTR